MGTGPVWSLVRIRSGEYLGYSDDQRVLFRLLRYEEDGSAFRDGGRPILGTYWRMEYATRDVLHDGYPVVERDRDGRIVGVDRGFVDELPWRDALSTCRTRREAWDYARALTGPEGRG